MVWSGMNEKLHWRKGVHTWSILNTRLWAYGIYCNIFYWCFSHLAPQASSVWMSSVQYLQMMRIMPFLLAWGWQHSRLEVTADHRVVIVTHEGEKRQVAEWWLKKSCFNIETQAPLRIDCPWLGIVIASYRGLCGSLGFIGFIYICHMLGRVFHFPGFKPPKKRLEVPAFQLRVGDLVMVDNQTESLSHVDFDPATFEVSWLFEILRTEWLVPLL